MYTIVFNFDGVEDDNNRMKEEIWFEEKEIYINDYIGIALYDFVNLNLDNKDNILNFYKKWKVDKLRSFRNNTIHLNEKNKLDNQVIDFLKNEQWYIERGLSMWLSIDNHEKKEKNTPIFGDLENNIPPKKSKPQISSSKALENMENSKRFFTYPLEIDLPLKIGPKMIYTKSKSTKDRQKKEINNILDEINNLEEEINQIRKEESEEKEEFWTKFAHKDKSHWNKEKMDKTFSKNIEIINKNYENKIYPLKLKIKAKKNKLNKLRSKGWKVVNGYKVEDVLSIIWLELLLSIENNIKARKCSLCNNLFLIYGRKSITRCPNCNKNPTKAWRKHKKQ